MDGTFNRVVITVTPSHHRQNTVGTTDKLVIVNDYALAVRIIPLYSVRIVNKVVNVFFTSEPFSLPLKRNQLYMVNIGTFKKKLLFTQKSVEKKCWSSILIVYFIQLRLKTARNEQI